MLNKAGAPATKRHGIQTKGLRILPLRWLQALEQPDSDKPFLAPEYMAGFRYLPGPPIGFVIDAKDDSQLSVTKLRWKEWQSSKEPWVGLTCSACHSNELTYNGKRLRVEGAPSLTDYQSFTTAAKRSIRRGSTTRNSHASRNKFSATMARIRTNCATNWLSSPTCRRELQGPMRRRCGTGLAPRRHWLCLQYDSDDR
jgi:hypothetical protein